MSLELLNQSLIAEIENLKKDGRAKMPERVIIGYIPPKGNTGCRYLIEGQADKAFIRMNTNGYLSLAHHPKLIEAADTATHEFGVGPEAVRFIDGTFKYHIALEKRIALFTGKPSAKIFNSAYTSNLALSLTLSSEHTYWIGDALNHNSIIRAMRIANVPRTNRSFYKHNDIDSLNDCLEQVPKEIERVCVIFDGIFSMRGDCALMADIKICINKHQSRFAQGVITVVDDSHGIGAYGNLGRGTCEYTNTDADIIIGTFGKAFGVNGGFIAASEAVTEAIRQKADTYIYTNPLSVADCAAGVAAIDFVDSSEGQQRLAKLQQLTKRFRKGLSQLGYESIEGPHPVVPILIRDTNETHRLVTHLFKKGILVIGLTFPVVPKGDETLRIQINSGLTMTDIDYVLNIIADFKR